MTVIGAEQVGQHQGYLYHSKSSLLANRFYLLYFHHFVDHATKVGKDLGRDVVLGKATFPSLLGIDEAKLRLDALREGSVTAMSGWGDKARPLLDLMDVVITRES